MWLQYVADVGSAPEHIEAASIRASLRRMSHAIIVLETKNDQGAAVLPEDEEQGSETAGSPKTNIDDTDHKLRGEDKTGHSIARTLATLGNSIVLALIAVGYPIAVLPYYRAKSTTE